MSKQLEIVSQRQEVALAAEDPIGLFKLAIESKAGADTLERVMAVRRELRAERAQEAFEAALSDFQSACPAIAKTKGVKTNAGVVAYKYAPIEIVEAIIRPIESKHGFNHTFDTDTDSAAGWVIAKCIVTHRAGHSRSSTVKMPLGTKTNIMSDTQQFSAALTFANRRALCNAYGLVLIGEDIDGAGGNAMTEAEELKHLAKTLWRCLPFAVAGKSKDWSAAKQYLVDENFLTPEEHGGDDHAPRISTARFSEIIAKLRAKSE